jgi:hypothetical protein
MSTPDKPTQPTAEARRAIALPIKLGMKGGFNACFITDANNSTLCQMYGIPLHSTVEEVRAIDDPHGRWTDGLAKADELVKIVNTYEQTQADLAELVAALEHAEIVMANLRGDLLAGREINRKECAANLLLNAEKYRAVLARHAGAVKVS